MMTIRHTTRGLITGNPNRHSDPELVVHTALRVEGVANEGSVER